MLFIEGHRLEVVNELVLLYLNVARQVVAPKTAITAIPS